LAEQQRVRSSGRSTRTRTSPARERRGG
jgi:hypothetical protein